jgi:hypothetical protein
MIKLVPTEPISMTGTKMNQFIPYTDKQWKYEVMTKCMIGDGKEKVQESTAVGKISTHDWKHQDFTAN